MDSSLLSRILSLVPERLARIPSGTKFSPHAAATVHDGRLDYLAQQLGWLTPLVSQDKESQQRLGLLNAAGRPLMAVEESIQDLAEEAEDAVS